MDWDLASGRLRRDEALASGFVSSHRCINTDMAGLLRVHMRQGLTNASGVMRDSSPFHLQWSFKSVTPAWETTMCSGSHILATKPAVADYYLNGTSVETSMLTGFNVLFPVFSSSDTRA